MSDYFIIIPHEVRTAPISALAKVVYGEILCLTAKEGYCYAKNKYFADLYGVREESISRIIRQLIKCSFVRSTGQGRARKLYTIDKNVNVYKNLAKNVKTTLTKMSRQPCEKSQNIINKQDNIKKNILFDKNVKVACKRSHEATKLIKEFIGK